MIVIILVAVALLFPYLTGGDELEATREYAKEEESDVIVPVDRTPCKCGVCTNGNTTEILISANASVPTHLKSRVYLAAHRGTSSNKKKRQKPLFLYLCERRPLPGYPHAMKPPVNMRTPRVSTSNPHGLAYGSLFKKAAGAKKSLSKYCVNTNRTVALFLGDSLTFGTLVQSRFNWPVAVDPKTGFEPNNSIHSTALYWRVAIQMLENRIPSKRGTPPQSGEYWWRRSYPVGRGGMTAAEFNEDYLNATIEFLEGSKSGEVTLVSYFLGINDALVEAENRVNASESFTHAADTALTEIRKRFKGPIIIGTIPFSTDPGRLSGEWIARDVWYNWALDPINDAVRTLAKKHHAGIGDYFYTLSHWRKHLPQIDGVHPAWWAHKVFFPFPPDEPNTGHRHRAPQRP
eukprot:TRINITY_DN2774_c1_g1_i1.p1 TRINITY_DN2774_c1_g1~~TRINITY_DN2774_c1_g1_i1.p1  ORF type:complete len:421 (+),score=66.89 TRINITY_DN2774_c1_g1_i1:53-1264(+)